MQETLQEIVWNQVVARGLERSPVFVLHDAPRRPRTSHHRQPGIELHFSHRGRGSYHVEDQLYVQSGCDLIVTPGSCAHQVYANIRTRFTRTVVCLGEPIPKWLSSDPEFQRLGELLRTPGPVQYYFSPEVWEEVEQHLQRLDREHTDRRTGWRGALFAHVIHLLILIDRSATTTSPPCDNYIAHCLKIIDANLGDDLLLVDLAKEVAVTPKHLSREFHQTVGLPLAEYVWHRRVAKAKELLASRRDLSAQEVARRSGFKTASHFTRKFAELTGMTPTQYRLRSLAQGPSPLLASAPSGPSHSWRSGGNAPAEPLR